MRGVRSNVTRWVALCIVIAASLGFGAPAGAVPVTPNDPGFHLQWNLRMIGAPEAWQMATGMNITIAIVDSGVDLAHVDLKDKVIGHVTCVGSAGDTAKCVDGGQDDNGHGSHVAGIAAATTNNNEGVAGVAPDAAILDVKVLQQSCDTIQGCDASGSPDDVAAGIKYAADHGAAVINLSLGNASQSVFGPSFQDALKYAFDKGAIPVIAAGNNFVLPSGGAVNAIVVGALNNRGSAASYSNSIGDAQWALMAPGGEPDTDAGCKSAPVGVLSTYLNGYACLAGTSMAAPHVSGAAAVLRSMGFSKQDTIARLLNTAKRLDPPAFYGSGALDLAAAVGVTATTAPPTTSTAPKETTLSTGSVASGSSSGGIDGSTASSASEPNSPPVSTPSGDLGGPTSTSPAGVISLPGQQAAAAPGGVITRSPSTKSGLSPGLVAVAVLMAAGVGVGTGWFLRRGNLARRTPPS
jgi:serine protease